MQPPLASVLQPLINAFEAILKFVHDDIGLAWHSPLGAATTVKGPASSVTVCPISVRFGKAGRRGSGGRSRRHARAWAGVRMRKIPTGQACADSIAS
jgi:hypothetical protein